MSTQPSPFILPPAGSSLPSPSARQAIACIKKIEHDRLLAGQDFLTHDEEAAIVDHYCPVLPTLALLARQRKIDELSPAARPLEQRAIDVMAQAIASGQPLAAILPPAA